MNSQSKSPGNDFRFLDKTERFSHEGLLKVDTQTLKTFTVGGDGPGPSKSGHSDTEDLYRGDQGLLKVDTQTLKTFTRGDQGLLKVDTQTLKTFTGGDQGLLKVDTQTLKTKIRLYSLLWTQVCPTWSRGCEFSPT
ncbi:hypothetical protein STEG23_031646 [Scotinomys teguina]